MVNPSSTVSDSASEPLIAILPEIFIISVTTCSISPEMLCTWHGTLEVQVHKGNGFDHP
jgi:hypothetical protein